MIREEIKNIKSEKSDVRKFGISVGIVIGILGGLFLWRDKGFYNVFFIIAVALIFFGLFFPSILKPVQRVWMIFAVVMGWFMTRLILGVLFYLVFTLVRAIAALSGKKFLDLKFNMSNNENSYWILRETRNFLKSDYENQF